jgi:outer membrane immunogenic protein
MTSTPIRTALAALTLVAASVTAQAADMKVKAPIYKAVPPPVAAYNWSGFYLGINGGGAWGDSSWAAPPVLAVSATGALAGLTYGYNIQSGSWVFGLEGDVDWADISGATTCGAGTCAISARWLDTVRLRAGQSFDRFMPYITGGLALGGVRASNSVFATANSTQVGWTVGAGIELGISRNLSAKLEYLYVDLGSFDCGLSCGLGVPENIGLTANVIRAGLNYKFDLGGPISARY